MADADKNDTATVKTTLQLAEEEYFNASAEQKPGIQSKINAAAQDEINALTLQQNNETLTEEQKTDIQTQIEALQQKIVTGGGKRRRKGSKKGSKKGGAGSGSLYGGKKSKKRGGSKLSIGGRKSRRGSKKH